ncbi:uncharacterized protein LOC142979117 [Anticarsia gemmatalis]|uniref:uncharacterized protein LOC142979117 n=1 Tax=Anticarsia gemmatalis TaxID=129554 RepID=UPI003F766497
MAEYGHDKEQPEDRRLIEEEKNIHLKATKPTLDKEQLGDRSLPEKEKHVREEAKYEHDKEQLKDHHLTEDEGNIMRKVTKQTSDIEPGGRPVMDKEKQEPQRDRHLIEDEKKDLHKVTKQGLDKEPPGSIPVPKEEKRDTREITKYARDKEQLKDQPLTKEVESREQSGDRYLTQRDKDVAREETISVHDKKQRKDQESDEKEKFLSDKLAKSTHGKEKLTDRLKPEEEKGAAREVTKLTQDKKQPTDRHLSEEERNILQKIQKSTHGKEQLGDHYMTEPVKIAERELTKLVDDKVQPKDHQLTEDEKNILQKITKSTHVKEQLEERYLTEKIKPAVPKITKYTLDREPPGDRYNAEKDKSYMPQKITKNMQDIEQPGVSYLPEDKKNILLKGTNLSQDKKKEQEDIYLSEEEKRVLRKVTKFTYDEDQLGERFLTGQTADIINKGTEYIVGMEKQGDSYLTENEKVILRNIMVKSQDKRKPEDRHLTEEERKAVRKIANYTLDIKLSSLSTDEKKNVSLKGTKYKEQQGDSYLTDEEKKILRKVTTFSHLTEQTKDDILTDEEKKTLRRVTNVKVPTDITTEEEILLRKVTEVEAEDFLTEVEKATLRTVYIKYTKEKKSIKKPKESLQAEFKNLIQSKVKEISVENLQKDLSFFFPNMSQADVRKPKRRVVTSAELIENTRENLRLKAEEEQKKLELERKKQLEEEERKRIAREERKRQKEADRLEKEQREKEEKQRKLEEEKEEKRRKLEEEKEEKRRKLEEEKEEKRRRLEEEKEEKRRKLEADKDEKRKKTDEDKDGKTKSTEEKRKPVKETTKPLEEKTQKSLQPSEEKEPKKRQSLDEKEQKKRPLDEEKTKVASKVAVGKKESSHAPQTNGDMEALKQLRLDHAKNKEEELKNRKELERQEKLARDAANKAQDGKELTTTKPLESKPLRIETKDKKPAPIKKEEPEIEVPMNQIKLRQPSMDDLMLRLIKIKQAMDPHKLRTRPDVDHRTLLKERDKIIKSLRHMSKDSDMQLTRELLERAMIAEKEADELNDIIIGDKIAKYKLPFPPAETETQEAIPMVFHIQNLEDPPLVVLPPKEEKVETKVSNTNVDIIFPSDMSKKKAAVETVDPDLTKGIIRYALSDRTFIEKGWTMLPTEKVVRKMNVYRMRPAHPEFDWFEHNKNKRLMTYDTGEKLAEFEESGRGRWYYRNGRLALDYYDAEETNAQQRFVVYSSGEPDERGRSHPITILATFDYLGNGIVFDHAGKIRLKYNQTEGVVLDRGIGPVSHWKWHTLNDPPVLQQVMIDTQMAHKDPDIYKLGGPGDKKARPDNEEMLAIEFDNFIKEKSKKLSQKFKPFQIKMKALKINEHFSLKVLDQATIYLIYRDGSTNLKLNIGMVLDHQEIVDTDTAEVGEVSNNLERLPARTDSLAGLQRSVAYAQRFERMRTERDRRLRPSAPCASADLLVAAASRPLRPPLRTVPSRSSSGTGICRCSRKPPSNVYYNTRLT